MSGNFSHCSSLCKRFAAKKSNTFDRRTINNLRNQELCVEVLATLLGPGLRYSASRASYRAALHLNAGAKPRPLCSGGRCKLKDLDVHF